MFPHKEDLHFFEKLAENQIQIYNDSCDSGIITNSLKDIVLKKHLKRITDHYGMKKTVSETTKSVEVFIPIEINDYSLDSYDGVTLKVSLNIDKRLARCYDGEIAFWSIEFGFRTVNIKRMKDYYNSKLCTHL